MPAPTPPSTAATTTARSAHARELLALEPLSEGAHRRLIRVLYLQGDRAAALLAFDRCEQMLKDEVGAAPSAETLALLATISGAGLPALPAPAQGLPASVLLPPRLIGRDAAWRALHEAWDAGRNALVSGEGGMGKSRLVGDFARARGRTLVVGARPGDEPGRLRLAARLLRALPAGFLHGLDPPLRRTLAWLLPELGEPAAPPGSQGQARLFNAVGAALEAETLALEGIVFDDLHFADATSIELLQYAIGASTRRWIVDRARRRGVGRRPAPLLDEALAPGAGRAGGARAADAARHRRDRRFARHRVAAGRRDRGDAAAALRRQSALPARDAQGLDRRPRRGRRRRIALPARLPLAGSCTR